MVHLHSPGSRPLAVPGVGFPQDVSFGPKVVDLAAFRRASGDAITNGRKRAGEFAPTDDRDHLPPQLIACIAVAFITMAVIVGPLVAWMLSRAAALAS
jgi:hypothetical protein